MFDLDQNALSGLALKAWKASPSNESVLAKDDGSVNAVLKSIDDVISFIRDSGGSDEDVELAADSFKASEADGSTGVVLGVTASTDSVDRQNDTIKVSGWDLKAYKKNPVILFGHDARALPIGKATSTFKDEANGALKQVIAFNSRDLDERGDRIGRLYEARVMRAFSVGFRALDWSINEERSGDSVWDIAIDFNKQELLEDSAVNIPANSEALADAKSLGEMDGFLSLAIETIERCGGWAFAPADAKAVYSMATAVEGRKFVLVDMANKSAIDISESAVREAADMKFAHADVEPEMPESDGVDDEEKNQPIGGDAESDEGLLELPDDMGEIVRGFFNDAISPLNEKLKSLEESFAIAHTAATGRLD